MEKSIIFNALCARYICFHCQDTIEVGKEPVLVHAFNQKYYFHAVCARQIIVKHITEIVERERDLLTRAAQEQQRNALADKLAYKMNTNQEYGKLAPPQGQKAFDGTQSRLFHNAVAPKGTCRCNDCEEKR